MPLSQSFENKDADNVYAKRPHQVVWVFAVLASEGLRNT